MWHYQLCVPWGCDIAMMPDRAQYSTKLSDFLGKCHILHENKCFVPATICLIFVFLFLQQVELCILYLASSLTEIAFVIFHPRNSSFSPMKKFAQLLPTTAFASDNQFINISNPDPFTLLKLISTKYVFPKSCSQIPIPIQFFCQPNLIKSHKFNRSFQIEKRPKKSPQLFKAQNWWWNWWQFSAFEIQIFCLTGRALSYLYWKIQNPTPRRKIEFLTDCCFNFQFNLGANEYINSNVHRTASQWRKKERKKESCQKRKKESCQNNPIPICLNWL